MTLIRNLATHAEPTVTVEELAAYWRVDRRALYRDIEKGALKATRIGRVIRIRIEDARAYGTPADSGLIIGPIASVRS